VRPLVSVSVHPINASVMALREALRVLAGHDPTLSFDTELPGTSVMIYGMGEIHLGIVLDRLLREHTIQVEARELQIIYLETIRRASEAEGKFIRQSSARGQYAHVKLRIDPDPENGYRFVNDAPPSVVPERFISSIEEGVRIALKGGVLAGYEMTDLKVILYDGGYHELYSDEMTFKIAASMAMKEAARKASPVVLEPVMSVEVVVPEEFMGTIIDDLNSRRGRIGGMEHRAGSQVIKAMVPLSDMFGYATQMRSATQGRATFAMHFARYEPAPSGQQGGDEGGAGVTANTPVKPAPRSGTASAQPPTDS
jgi:elongation factor G